MLAPARIHTNGGDTGRNDEHRCDGDFAELFHVMSPLDLGLKRLFDEPYLSLPMCREIVSRIRFCDRCCQHRRLTQFVTKRVEAPLIEDVQCGVWKPDPTS